jgi:hypothetical protein
VIFLKSSSVVSPGFGWIDPPRSYSFWYSDDARSVERASVPASANLYNEKSLKPHLKQ